MAEAGSGTLQSERLQLVPMTLELVEAALAGDRAKLSEVLGASVPEGWPGGGLLEYGLPADREAIAADPTSAPWRTRLLLLDGEAGRELIGTASLKGRPTSDGAVAVGAEIQPERRRTGLAREALHALISWAFTHPEVERAEAYVADGNEPSCALVYSLGMVRSGVMDSPETGPCNIWAVARAQWR